jgi:hypothetical protein
VGDGERKRIERKGKEKKKRMKENRKNKLSIF